MSARTRRAGAPWELPLALAAVTVAGVLVFRGALAYFFAQDDFAGLARSAGQLPRLGSPWRYVSGQLYFDAMRVLAGLNPAAYHGVSLAAHAACAMLLLLVLRARVSVAAALTGGFVFVTHPALYTALYSISGIGEILALVFALGTILAARVKGSARWMAVPLFALSLLSKESLLLLPAVVALDGRGKARAADGRGARAPLLFSLALVAAGYLAVFLTHDIFGVWKSLPAQAPYALAFDSTLAANLLTYAGWAANFTVAGVQTFSDAVDPLVAGWGAGALLVLAAGCFVPALRERGWALGAAVFLAFLLPVLPLAHHTYHYYLYAPLAGIAACVAAGADIAVDAFASRRATPPVLAALGAGALLTWNGATLVHKVETMPFLLPVLRADPTVDRARIALRIRDGLARTALVPGERLVFWSPSSIAFDHARGRDAGSETYWERNVRTALSEGVALRVLFPQLGAVEFTHEFLPDGSGARWALYAPDGRVQVLTPAEVEASLRAGRLPP